MSDGSIDSRAFRNALGAFATGVTVVTARTADGRPFGITANSFSSVSLEPPMVLWCIGRDSDTFQHFMDTDHFAINVLGSDDADVSNRMAQVGDHALDGLAWREGEAAAMPVLDAALSVFECRIAHRYDGGDHVILVGEVQRFSQPAEGDPLVYYRGKYAAIAS